MKLFSWSRSAAATPPPPTWFDRLAEDGKHCGYAVDLLTPAPLRVDARRLLAKVRETYPDADLISDGPITSIAFPAYPIVLADRTICYSVMVVPEARPA